MANYQIATQNTEKNSSAFKSAAWTKLSPSWKITSDLWGSALDIRNLGTEYLTKFNQEPQDKYNARLANSIFKNEFRGGIETMAGMVFRTDPKPDDVHEEIAKLLPDIDMCGNSFWAWNLHAFQKFLRDGLGFIYVDAPPLNTQTAEKVASGIKPTLSDRRDDRVFWVFYHASQIINYRHEKIGSRSVLSRVTIEEKVMDADGEFGEIEVLRHRILRRGSWELMKFNKDTQKFDIFEDGGLIGLEDIPLIPIGDFNCIPPLLDLAMLNQLLYNQKSDYDDICHLVCTPLRVDKYDTLQDAQDAKKLQVASPGVGKKIWGNASVTYTEVSGTGMDKARERYQDVEKEMAAIGVGMLAPSDVAGTRTATEVMDTAGQRQSKLSNYTRQYENAVEKALYVTALYINLIKGSKTIDLDNAEEKTKMRLKIDYERLTFSIEQLTFFNDLVDSNKLSLETFLTWLPQVADMPPGFSPADELKKLANVNAILTDD